MKRLFLAIGLFAGTFFCACEKTLDVPATTPIVLSNGVQILVEIADDDATRMRGLQGRKNLPENHGMLFVYSRGDRRAFWMKDTLIDLSIGYFDSAGTLVEIYEMKAGDENSTISRSRDIKYVLEMPAGWYARHGISAGTVSLKLK